MSDITKNELYKSFERLYEKIRYTTKRFVRKMQRDIAMNIPYYAKGWRTKITLKRRIKK